MKKRKYYIHTIHGQPAYFVKGEQIYYCCDGLEIPRHLVASLKTIKNQRDATIAYRIKHGLTVTGESDKYGVLRVTIEKQTKEV